MYERLCKRLFFAGVLCIVTTALTACAANRFSSVVAPDMIPATELAKFRCAQLGLGGDKDCLLKQYEHIMYERSEVPRDVDKNNQEDYRDSDGR